MSRTAKLVRKQKSKKKTTRKSPPKSKKRVAKKVARKASRKKTTHRMPASVKKKVVVHAEAPRGVKVGERVPEFSLSATSEKTVSLAHLQRTAIVLYFYPKDSTPGCTLEGHDFKKLYPQFQSANCEVFGVSRDSLKSHANFKSKCGFPFELLSDENEHLCRLFDVIRMKKLYGREFEGIERSTFVIDANHILRTEWRKVKVEGHAQEVLEFVKSQLS